MTSYFQHIVSELTNLKWHVEEDQFYADTPYKAGLSFTNIIATLDPLAPRRLVLACHYDTLNTTSGKFVGATDSAVPCAQLLNLAHVMQSHFNTFKQQVRLCNFLPSLCKLVAKLQDYIFLSVK